jgi:hypothetical protein
MHCAKELLHTEPKAHIKTWLVVTTLGVYILDRSTAAPMRSIPPEELVSLVTFKSHPRRFRQITVGHGVCFLMKRPDNTRAVAILRIKGGQTASSRLKDAFEDMLQTATRHSLYLLQFDRAEVQANEAEQQRVWLPLNDQSQS